MEFPGVRSFLSERANSSSSSSKIYPNLSRLIMKTQANVENASELFV